METGRGTNGWCPRLRGAPCEPGNVEPGKSGNTHSVGKFTGLGLEPLRLEPSAGNRLPIPLRNGGSIA